jgi:hypothetical protein
MFWSDTYSGGWGGVAGEWSELTGTMGREKLSFRSLGLTMANAVKQHNEWSALGWETICEILLSWIFVHEVALS